MNRGIIVYINVRLEKYTEKGKQKIVSSVHTVNRKCWIARGSSIFNHNITKAHPPLIWGLIVKKTIPSEFFFKKREHIFQLLFIECHTPIYKQSCSLRSTKTDMGTDTDADTENGNSKKIKIRIRRGHGKKNIFIYIYIYIIIMEVTFISSYIPACLHKKT